MFALNSTIASDSNMDRDDILKTKKALNQVGHFPVPDWGLTDFAEASMIDGVKSYQEANGLEVDGVMRPGGPTEASLREKLTKPVAGTPATPPKYGDPWKAPRVPNPMTAPKPQTATKMPPPPTLPPTPPKPQHQPITAQPTVALPPITDEAIAGNRRLVDAALKIANPGTLVDHWGKTIEEFGDQARAVFADFISQLRKRNPEAALRFHRAVEPHTKTPNPAPSNDLLASMPITETDHWQALETTSKPSSEPNPLLELSDANQTSPGQQMAQGASTQNQALAATGSSYQSTIRQDWRDQIAGHESGSAGYQAVNKSQNAFGRYQMKEAALIDAGVKDHAGNWTGKFGLNSLSDFLKNPDAQEQAFDAYMAANERYLRSKGLDQYFGAKFSGVLGKGIHITKSGILAAIHRAGSGVVKEYFEWQKANNWSSNFPPEIAVKMKEVEFRLREFQNTPYK